VCGINEYTVMYDVQICYTSHYCRHSGTAGLLWVAFAVLYVLCTRSLRRYVPAPTLKIDEAIASGVVAEYGGEGNHLDGAVSIAQSERMALLPQRKTKFSVPWLTLFRRFSFW